MTTTPTYLLLLLLASLCAAELPPQRPIIGIYTQAAEDFGQAPGDKQTYIAASYVKNIEMAGAQVIPLFYHYSKAQLDDILSNINGVFFPGGQMPIDLDNQWTSNMKHILDYAIQQNDNGNPFPIWGTCLSEQAMLYITSGIKDNMTTISHVNGQRGLRGNITVVNPGSVLIKSMSKEELQQATTGEGLFWFHHNWAITLDTFKNNPKLNSFWKLVTTSVTQDGVVFVSTAEAYNYPFWITQHHPEKNSFEWRIDALRTYNSISVEQKHINEFTKVARMNKNTMTDAEWTQKWIYNYQPLYTEDPDFIQVYIFDESKL